MKNKLLIGLTFLLILSCLPAMAQVIYSGTNGVLPSTNLRVSHPGGVLVVNPLTGKLFTDASVSGSGGGDGQITTNLLVQLIATNSAAINAVSNEVATLKNGIPGTNVFSSRDKTFSATLTLDTAQYAAGDTFSDKFELANVALVSGGTSWLIAIIVEDDDAQGGAFDIVFFDRDYTLTGNKNAAWAVSDGDMANSVYVKRITSSDYLTLGSGTAPNKQAILTGLNIPMTSNATSIFVGTVSQDTKTYSANGLKIKFVFSQNPL